MEPFKTKATFSHSGDKNAGYLGFLEDDVIQILDIVDIDTFYGMSMRTKQKGKIAKKHVMLPEIKRGHSSSSTIDTDLSLASNYGGSHTTFTNDTTDKAPPPTPKHEDDLGLNRRFKSSYVQQLILNSSLTDTEKSSSLFGHSDFSATSAGSYIRHKESKAFDFTDGGGNPLRDRLNTALSEVEFNRSKKSGFLQRIMGKANDREMSFDDSLIMSMERHTMDEIDDSAISVGNTTAGNDELNSFENNLKRTVSVNGKERSVRSKRLAEQQPDLVLKPHEFITEFNKNEVIANYVAKPVDINEDKVDMVLHYLLNNPTMSLEKIIIIMKNKLDNDLERHKTLYLFLTKFRISESILEKVSLKRMPNFEDLPNILRARKCSNHQLVWIYYIFGNRLGFDLEMILGFFKYPYKFDESVRDSNQKLTINHSWISVQFNGTYYFCDPVLGNINCEIIQSSTNEDNYILMKPFETVSTHIPMHIDQQHITPPIDPIVQLNMPPNYPFFNKFGIKFINYNTSLFHLKDYEIFDFKLKIPLGVQIKCHFQPFDQDMYPIITPFVQVYFNDRNEKIVNVKGILPQFCPSGVLVVRAKETKNNFWEIITSIPVYHVGKWKQIKWAKVDTSSVERLGSCYIKTPKISKLPYQSQVKFKFKLTNFKSKRLILVSPRNKKFSFEVNGSTVEQTIQIEETGDWKLVVPDVERNVLKIIAQWTSE